MPIRSALIALLATVALLTTPSAAMADAALTDSTPADKGTVASAGEQTVTFRFNQELMEVGAVVVIQGSAGNEVSTGDVQVDGRAASRTFDASAPGRYTASYRVVSSDSHPVDGTIEFTVEGTGASTTPAPAVDDAAADDTAEQAESSGDVQGTPWIPITISAIAILAVVASVVRFGAAGRRQT